MQNQFAFCILFIQWSGKKVREVVKTCHIQTFQKNLPQGNKSAPLECVQDFLIKLDMKPCMHLVEISIFSLNHVIMRPIKILNNILKVCKICTFEVIFQHKKSTESFWFFFLWRMFDKEISTLINENWDH